MHTLRPSNNTDQWDVYFDGPSKSFVVAPDLPKDEAMKMVNYLNGGLGHQYGSSPSVETWQAEV